MSDSDHANSEPGNDLFYAAYETLKRGDAASLVALRQELERSTSPVASDYLGYMHATGKGGPQDLDKAAHYYRIAAEGGMLPAMHMLGEIARARGDVAESLKWFRASASLGYGPSLYRMYRAHRATDEETAMAFLHAAAEKDYFFARRDLLRLECRGKFGFVRQTRAILVFPFVLVAGFATLVRQIMENEITSLKDAGRGEKANS